MGLLNKLFGGGTSLQLNLDATQVPLGGILSGAVVLHGGKKPLTLTALNLRLAYILVKTKEGSSLPEIDTKIVLEQVLAAGRELPANAEERFEFRVELPSGLAISGDGVSYKVMVAADIPKVADPTADATLTVVGRSTSAGAGFSLAQLRQRFPDLESEEDDDRVEALRQFHLECYSERERLQIAEPILAAAIRGGSAPVRRQALEAWANLLDGCARKEHIKLLEDLLAQPVLDREFMRELITAACKFAEEGGLPLVKKLAASADPEIREQVASQLRFAAADKFRGKLDLLQALAADSVAEVRAAAIGGLSDFRDNKKQMLWVEEQLSKDPSPLVQAACVGTVALLHHNGLGEITHRVYEAALKNPHADVRMKVCEDLQWLPRGDLPRLQLLVAKLLADPSPEVRARMAWYAVNLRESPEIAPQIRKAADSDPDPKVRRDALFGLSSLLPAPELIAVYREKLSQEQDESLTWSVLSGARDHAQTPEGRALLEELTRAPWPGLAESAREALESAG